MLGQNCSSGCRTKSHATFGECVRDKGLRVAYCGQGGGDATVQRNWDAGLQAYRDARQQGIQPKTTQIADVRRAVEISNATGKPFQAA